MGLSHSGSDPSTMLMEQTKNAILTNSVIINLRITQDMFVQQSVAATRLYVHTRYELMAIINV